jgi:uncharacterized protein (TIGR02594 family)
MTASPNKSGTPWLDEAMKLLGQKEIAGPKHNDTIVSLWKIGKAGLYRDDETAWCAAFTSAALELGGAVSARTGWARGYLKWGQPLSGPARGCVVVFSRGPNAGHVGFVVGRDKGDNLLVLGGNQRDSVSIAPFPSDRILGYRWPNGYDLPKHTGKTSLPVIASDGKLSTNEA